jgi:prevent-host-death family protein
MSTVVSIREAKAQLSRIVEDVAAGAEVIIAKAGKPMVRLMPLLPTRRRKKLGLLKGKLGVSEDFNAPLAPELLAQFHTR